MIEISGGCQISDSGRFSAFLDWEGERAECTDPARIEWLYEFYCFLMSDDSTRKIGQQTIIKRKTRQKGLPMISFSEAGGDGWTMIRSGKGSFCILVRILAFKTSPKVREPEVLQVEDEGDFVP